MKLNRISYRNLNPKQKEIYNFQKVAALLADYGFNCIKLADDWQGADFLAYHIDGKETLRVQLKARLTLKKEYENKNLSLAFPVRSNWYLIEHDRLLKLVEIYTPWLNSSSWKNNGVYSSASPNRNLLDAMNQNILH